jgi:hypothetical protein
MDASVIAPGEQVGFLKAFGLEMNRIMAVLVKKGPAGARRRFQLGERLVPLVMERVWEDPALRAEAVQELRDWLMEL